MEEHKISKCKLPMHKNMIWRHNYGGRALIRNFGIQKLRLLYMDVVEKLLKCVAMTKINK